MHWVMKAYNREKVVLTPAGLKTTYLEFGHILTSLMLQAGPPSPMAHLVELF